jgi:hypothetical protein
MSAEPASLGAEIYGTRAYAFFLYLCRFLTVFSLISALTSSADYYCPLNYRQRFRAFADPATLLFVMTTIFGSSYPSPKNFLLPGRAAPPFGVVILVDSISHAVTPLQQEQQEWQQQ